jgi:hypothetical protein
MLTTFRRINDHRYKEEYKKENLNIILLEIHTSIKNHPHAHEQQQQEEIEEIEEEIEQQQQIDQNEFVITMEETNMRWLILSTRGKNSPIQK